MKNFLIILSNWCLSIFLAALYFLNRRLRTLCLRIQRILEGILEFLEPLLLPAPQCLPLQKVVRKVILFFYESFPGFFFYYFAEGGKKRKKCPIKKKFKIFIFFFAFSLWFKESSGSGSGMNFNIFPHDETILNEFPDAHS